MLARRHVYLPAFERARTKGDQAVNLKGGRFGQFLLVAFVLFNIFMVVWSIGYWAHVQELSERQRAEFPPWMGVFFLSLIWVAELRFLIHGGGGDGFRRS